MNTMKKIGKFLKRMVKGYFEMSAQNYAMRYTGNVYMGQY